MNTLLIALSLWGPFYLQLVLTSSILIQLTLIHFICSSQPDNKVSHFFVKCVFTTSSSAPNLAHCKDYMLIFISLCYSLYIFLSKSSQQTGHCHTACHVQLFHMSTILPVLFYNASWSSMISFIGLSTYALRYLYIRLTKLLCISRSTYSQPYGHYWKGKRSALLGRLYALLKCLIASIHPKA
jgi:hypothetical protein